MGWGKGGKGGWNSGPWNYSNRSEASGSDNGTETTRNAFIALYKARDELAELKSEIKKSSEKEERAREFQAFKTELLSGPRPAAAVPNISVEQSLRNMSDQLTGKGSGGDHDASATSSHSATSSIVSSLMGVLKNFTRGRSQEKKGRDSKAKHRKASSSTSSSSSSGKKRRKKAEKKAKKEKPEKKSKKARTEDVKKSKRKRSPSTASSEKKVKRREAVSASSSDDVEPVKTGTSKPATRRQEQASTSPASKKATKQLKVNVKAIMLKFGASEKDVVLPVLEKPESIDAFADQIAGLKAVRVDALKEMIAANGLKKTARSKSGMIRDLVTHKTVEHEE